MKKRKERHKPFNEICSCCGWVNCDSAHSFVRTRYVVKTEYRKANGLCLGCGHNPCTCKSKS